MAEFDERGRIKRLERMENRHAGHSVCGTCGKDMPGCWDTVCFMCGATSCYAHSYTHKGTWLCQRCYKLTRDKGVP